MQSTVEGAGWRRRLLAVPRVPDSVVEGVAWVAAALGAGLLVVAGQVAGRGPLLWDEAARVEAGERLRFVLDPVDMRGVWEWISAQTYYPFLEPALHGVALRLGASPVAAAWLPSVIAFALSGLLASRIVAALGGGHAACGAVAGLVWLTPLNIRLAGGAFTENVGACALLGIVLLFVRLVRRPSWWTAAGIGVLVASAWAIKYPYGLVATAAVGAALLATMGRLRTRYALVAVGSLVVLVGAELAINFDGRWAHVPAFAWQVRPRYVDVTYYLNALFNDRDVGFAPAVATLLLLGVAALAGSWRSRPETRPIVVMIVVWWVCYSSVAVKLPRLMGTMLPLMAVAAVAGFSELYRRHRASVPRLPLLIVTTYCAALLLLQLVEQSRDIDRPFRVIQANPSAVEAMAFIERQLPVAGRHPVAMLGPNNYVNPHAVRLAWDLKRGAPAPHVGVIPETAPPHRAANFASWLAVNQPARVLAIDTSPGSPFDSRDYRRNFASHRDYVRFARELEIKGDLVRVGDLVLDDGRMQVLVWRPSRTASWAPKAGT